MRNYGFSSGFGYRDREGFRDYLIEKYGRDRKWWYEFSSTDGIIGDDKIREIIGFMGLYVDYDRSISIPLSEWEFVTSFVSVKYGPGMRIPEYLKDIVVPEKFDVDIVEVEMPIISLGH